MKKPDHEKSREELIAELKGARAEIADYKAAAENDTFYRIAADQAQDVIWATDGAFAVRYVSPSVHQVLGYHPQEIRQMDWARILTPSSLEMLQTAIQYRLAMEKAGRGDEAPRLFESEWIRKDGQRITAETATRPLRDKDGRFAGIVGVSRDVTERKRMMDELRAKEARFRAMLDSGPTIAWIKDEAGRYIYLSRNFEKYFGIRGKEWIGKICEDLYPHEIAAKFTENDLQVIKNDRPMEFLEEAENADGERRVCRVVKIPIRNVEGKPSAAGFGFDITDQKRAEDALRKSERRFREAQKIARIANYERDLDTGRGYWSDEHFRLFGYAPGEVSHSFELFLNHIHPEDRDRIEKTLWEAYENLTPFAHDCRYLRRDGELRYARHAGRGEMDSDGTRWLRGTFQDITEQKQVETALRHSESHHRIIFEKSPLGMIRFSEDGAIIDCNEQFIRLMGSSRKKLIGFNTARQSTPKMREVINKALAGNTAVYEDEYTSITGAKTTHLRVVFNPIHPGRNPTGVIATLEDITNRIQTEKALRESEKRFRTIVDTVPQFIAYTDKTLRYRFVNKAYQDKFGLSPEDVIGKTLPQIIGRKAYEKARPHIEKALAGEVVRYHERFDYPVGGMRDMDGVLLPDIDEDGGVCGYYAVLTDITHYMAAADALRESEARFRTIFENAGDAILVTDKEGKYVDANTAALNLTGYSIAELRGLTIQNLTPPGKQAEFENEWHHFRTAGAQKGEYTLLCKDGAQVEVEYNAVTDISPGLHLSILRDITERKRQDQALYEALKKAEDASRIKSRFLANMSHELRTPLNAILGYCQILARDPSLSESNREKFLTIRKSGEHLLTLINDVLDIARIESGKWSLTPSPVELKSLLRNTVDVLRPRADRKGIFLEERIDPTLPAWVMGDGKRLRQVLLNLLSNAVKFTTSGSVTLRVFPSNEKIAFSVQDTGPGIPEDMRVAIFEAFQQVDTSTQHTEGTGLGLTISRNLVELMGGKIQVESSVGKGSEFRFAVKLPPVSHENKRKKSLWEETVLGYEKEHQKSLKTEDTDGDSKLLRLCSDEELANLRALAGTGDIVGIRKYAEQLRKAHPETGPFCDLLIHCAGNIDIAKITELLED